MCWWLKTIDYTSKQNVQIFSSPLSKQTLLFIEFAEHA